MALESARAQLFVVVHIQRGRIGLIQVRERQVMDRKAKGRISEETFDDFLKSQNMLDEAEEVAIKRVLAWQIAEAMKEQGITKTTMANAHAH